MKKETPFKGTGKIYTLSDKDGNVFYVGATVLHIKTRLAAHIAEARKPIDTYGINQKKCDRIRALNFEIIATIVELVPVESSSGFWANKCLEPTEIKWISKYLAEGIDLCNYGYEKPNKVVTPEFVGQSFSYMAS